MDFKQFRYFIAVAEESHVGRAALKLNIAQPAVSQQIQQLELQLGVNLFNRDNRRLSLTPAGELFLAEAKAAVFRAEHAVQVVRRAEKGELGQIKLGFVDSAMLGKATRELLRGFKRSHPQVELVLQGSNVADQFTALTESTLDAGIVRGPLPMMPDLLRAEMIEREELVVCLPTKHPLQSRSRISARDLRNELFVTPVDPPGVGLAGQVSFIAQEAGFVPRISQYAGQTTTMACLVASGFGIAILPVSLAQLQFEDVVYRSLETPSATHLYLISRADERRPVVRGFLESCRAYIAAGDLSQPSAPEFVRA